jgi:putative transposase
MTDLFLLSQAQMRRIERYFPLSHGVARVDDRRIVSAIVFVIKNGLRWRDAPPGYGPHKTIYNRFVRWSRLGVFNKIFAALAHRGGKPERVMIDATHLKAHRTAASLLKRARSPTYRAHQRRLELQAARSLRRRRTPARHALKRGADERLQGRPVDALRHAESQATPGRQGLRRRLVPRRPRQAPHHPLHSFESQPQNRDPP